MSTPSHRFSLRDLSPIHWAGIVVLAAIVALLLFGERDSQRRQARDLDALAACRATIRLAASSAATVPPVAPRPAGGSLQFLWPEGRGLRVPNSLGHPVDAWASCEVRNGAVVALIINGERVVP